MTSLTIDQVRTIMTQPEWRTWLYGAAVSLELPTTSWRVGDPERVILEILSYAANRWDATVSLIAQGGFLDWAATGSVTYTNPDGTTVTAPVSPDPSTDANPNGVPTFLDALCEQNFNLARIRLTNAGGALAILNTSASTYGPFDAGGYHVADPFNAATYSNTASLTIAPSTTVGTVSAAVDDGFGLIKITTALTHGLVTGDVVYLSGVGGTTEANGAWYVTVITGFVFTLDGSTFANAYTSGGTVYAPTVATMTADVAGSGSNSVDVNGDLAAHTVTTAVTSLIGVSVENLDPFEGSDTESNTAYANRARLKLQAITTNGARGAYEFYALSSITYAPLLNPPMAVSSAITRVIAVGDKATGHTIVYIANANGAPSTDDLNATDAVIQAYATPVAHTTTTVKATNVNVAAVFEVYLPAVYATNDTKSALIAAVQAYIRVLPIGGYSDPGLDYTNVLPIQDIIGVIFETGTSLGINIQNVTATLNGSAANVSLPVSSVLASVAKLVPATPTINWHPV